MEIIIGKTAGFCFGVNNAVTKTQELLKQKGNVYCLGELVHNKQVTEELKKNGLNVIDKITNAKENVIIRAHGEGQKTYTLANELGIKILVLLFILPSVLAPVSPYLFASIASPTPNESQIKRKILLNFMLPP